MKRFMKSCGFLALVLTVVGVTLGMIGRTVAGQDTINRVVEDVTGGRMHMDNGVMWSWGHTSFSIAGERAGFLVEQIADVGEVTEVAPVDNIEMSSVYQEDSVFWGDNVEEYSASDIRNLDIEMVGGYLYTSFSGDDQIYVETYGACKFESYVKKDTLYIRAVESASSWRNEEWSVYLYLPEGFSFEEVDMEMGAGEIYFDGLNARKASLQVGAGNVSMENIAVQDLETSVGAGSVWLVGMEVTDMDVEVGMGQFVAEGTVNGNIKAECAMGYVELGLMGSVQDFNYKLDGSMGNIDLEDSYGGGFVKKQTIDNGADKNIDIECSMGSVSIWFMY